MYSFKNDYSEGAHPAILQRLMDTNQVQQDGYGEDAYSSEAKQQIKNIIGNQQAEIYFVSGGTQTNLLVISYLLRPHEAIISAKTGHIYANETGAIEATGHRIIPVDSLDGKLKPADIEQVLADYSLRPHVVKPKLVYISNSTEIGTHYSKTELTELSAYCQSKNLFLFLDGARLGHALMAKDNDLTLADVSKLTDVFYIGGTKNGALLGEAIVFNRTDIATEFDYHLKQKGALLAKGRVIGIQFLELFKDDLYFSLATHANAMAMKIAKVIENKGYTFLTQSSTNQLFPILPNDAIAKLTAHYDFYVWKPLENNCSAIRILTSWNTDEEVVDQFIEELEEYL
ncbi:threonine aldolase family protein [Sphingobacterium hungaricum]|uniref:Threonine aldolase n=1 Tax=Sphingobacterium hungaricum TaxID=2082723 RepID=A0A928YRG8_9SPHI|nr:aminotransferase class V-fold PLP-dependent enzyme [Sphingobacterium hungaricum]MBE8715286.1 threonine aldolase [Sphingobacterium hungaricum]